MDKISLYILLFTLTLNPFITFSQSDDYALENFIRYDDYTYDDSVKTILLYNTINELSYPIINLNSGEKIQLKFDDLGRGFKTYFYTFIHCNANWEPSQLSQNEYMEGFFENEIFNYKYSANTDVTYTHYSDVFPNENTKFLVSGNYILLVYEVNKKNQPIFTKRFMVVENRVGINMIIKRATDINESYFRQEIDFKINHEGYDIPNGYGKLNVVLMQNYRWDNAITGLKPKFVNDTELNYDYNSSENVFDANNEFRNFDIKSTQYQTIRVKSIAYNQYKGFDEVHLINDAARSFKKYYSEQDLNGNFLIKRNGVDDTDIQADYVNVHFTLPYSPPFQNGNVYLFGKFTDWKFKDEMRMEYDTTSLHYTKAVMLKQGYYNYLYCFVKDGSKNKGDISMIEGSHFETENEYSILVYHRGINDYYDRLVGYGTAKNRDN